MENKTVYKRSIMPNGKTGNVISIPREFVKKANLKKGDRFEAFEEMDTLMLKKSKKEDGTRAIIFDKKELYPRAFIPIHWIRRRGFNRKDKVFVEIREEEAGYFLMLY